MRYILEKIKEGEHQQLDFKFAITDSKKIARTLAAFSNVGGGSLLVGVKDNGAIAGVYSDEEYYMIEAAAEMYCKPAVKFQTKNWPINGKTVLEITVPESDKKPVRAPDKNGKLTVYIRVGDQNIIANKVMVRALRNKQKKSGVMLRYTQTESILLDYLSKHEKITFSEFKRLARISSYVAETVLAKLASLDVIKICLSEKECYYALHNVEEAV